jgi:hypothetical protein
MTTDPTYRKLTKSLSGTRKTLTQACRDVGVDIDDVDDGLLSTFVSQCSHCDIWGTVHVEDKDENPVCVLCYSLVGE